MAKRKGKSRGKKSNGSASMSSANSSTAAGADQGAASSESDPVSADSSSVSGGPDGPDQAATRLPNKQPIVVGVVAILWLGFLAFLIVIAAL